MRADVVRAVTGWLSTQPALAGVKISTRVPTDYDGTQRVVTVNRLGGNADRRMRFDYPRLDISCYGPDQGAAWDLTALVSQLLLVDILTADLSAWGTSLSDTHELVGPQWLDEPNYPVAGRYLMQITAMIHS